MPDLLPNIGVDGGIIGGVVGIGERVTFFQFINLAEYLSSFGL